MASSPAQRSGNAATAKYDTYVENQLARAGGRVRAVDVVTAVLFFGIAFLAYTLIVVALDYWLRLPSLVRTVMLSAFAAGILLYLGIQAFTFLHRRINPYYAARQLEKTIPEARDSIINWLDLREEPLPAVFRSALSTRAAGELKQADIDHVTSTGKNRWLAAGVVVLVLPLAFLFLMRPGQTASLLGRAFLPFNEIKVPTTTHLTLLEPKGGNASVAEKEPVLFRVRIEGRVPALDAPDAPSLLYRFRPSDPYVKKLLYNLHDNEWTAKLPASDILNGRVFYKIMAGDAETPEYQIEVLSDPVVLEYLVQYQPRPYRHWLKREVRFPNEHAVKPFIKEYEGTETVMQIKANRNLRSAVLELHTDQGIETIAGAPVKNAPFAMQFKFVLKNSGKFRVLYESQQSERNTDVSLYPLYVLKDEVPEVRLTKPGKDVKLPANGLLKVEGTAADDFGIKKVMLRMQLANDKGKQELLPKVYREGKSFKLPDGGYVQGLKYKDVVFLDKINYGDNSPVQLNPGMVLEYWLEAEDGCDYPKPPGHVGRSKTYKVLITAPENDQQKLEKQRQQAEKELDEHQQKQDKEFKDLQDEIKKQQNAADGKTQQTASNSPEKNEFDQKKLDELKKAAEDAQKERDKQQQNADAQKNKGSAKGKGGKGTEPGQQNPMKAQSQPNQPASDKKNAGKKSGKQGNSKSKDAGQQQQPAPSQNSQGQTKDKGPGQQPQSKAKGSDKDKQSHPDASSAKQQPPKQDHSSTKAADKKDGQPQGDSAKKKNANQKMKDKPSDNACCKKAGNGASQSGSAKGGKSSASGPSSAAAPKGGSKSGGSERNGAGAKKSASSGGATKAAQRKTGNRSTSPNSNNPAHAKGQTPGQGNKKGTQTAKNSGQGNGQKKSQGSRGLDQKRLEKYRKQIAEVEKKFKDADPKQREEMLKELKERNNKSNEKPDPELEQAIKEAMERAKGESSDTNKKDDTNNTAIAENKKPGNPENKNKDTVKTKNPFGTKASQKQSLPETAGNPDKANSAFAKKAGNLQLEHLKELLKDPAVRRQLQQKYNWTDEDVQRFLRQAKQYQQRLRARNDSLAAPGSFKSQIGGSGPRRVIGRPNRNPLNDDTGNGFLPPEYRRAYQRLTGEVSSNSKK